MSRPLRLAALLLLLSGAWPALAKKPLGPADRIDLAHATVAELTRLPGVGEKKAQAIVAARARKPFTRPEDVMSLKGLGPAWFAKVKQHLVVGTPAPAPAEPARR